MRIVTRGALNVRYVETFVHPSRGGFRQIVTLGAESGFVHFEEVWPVGAVRTVASVAFALRYRLVCVTLGKRHLLVGVTAVAESFPLSFQQTFDLGAVRVMAFSAFPFGDGFMKKRFFFTRVCGGF